MRPPCSWIFPALLALTVIGCASSAELARRSRRSLAAGDLRQAYETARRALDKDAENAEARAAFGAAATEMAIQYRTRIARIAPVDTVAAAREALEFRAFRAEVDRYPVAIAGDPDDLEVEARLGTAAYRGDRWDCLVHAAGLRLRLWSASAPAQQTCWVSLPASSLWVF